MMSHLLLMEKCIKIVLNDDHETEEPKRKRKKEHKKQIFASLYFVVSHESLISLSSHESIMI